MDMFIWDAYSPEEVNDKIKYWVDLWEDLIQNFNKRFYGLNLINPQLLIRNIIDEIEFNGLQSKENRNYFYKQLSLFLNHDPALRKRFATDFALIRREFNKGRSFYLLQLCKSVQEIFSSGKYFEDSYAILQEILLQPRWEEKDEENILLISQYLIVELLLKGYSLQSMGSFPRSLFARYYVQNGYIITEYPADTKWTDFTHGENTDECGFNEALKEEMDALTVPKRLQQFTKYYWSKPTRRYFIFQIEGLKGDVDFNIGDVNFYSPSKKRYIKGGSSLEHDYEYFHGDKNQYFINAAVAVEEKDMEASKTFAIGAIEKVLDVLRCFFAPNANFEILRENYLIVDSEGKHVGSSFSVSQRDKWYRWENALDLNAYDLDKVIGREVLERSSEFLFAPLEEQSDIEQKIGYSLHWYRKGEETNNSEDKLLHYWIVIENIMNFGPSLINEILTQNQRERRYRLAKELIPPIQVRNSIFELAKELHLYLHRLLNTRQGNRPLLTLPEELIDLCNLNPEPKTQVSLLPFIENLAKLGDAIERRIVKRKVLYAHSFYTNNHFAKEVIEKQIQQVKDDILLIYRYRNKIVHHAHFETTVLPYLAQKARKFAGDLLRKVLLKHSKDKARSVEEILVANYAKMNRIIEKLKKNVSVDFLNLDF